MVSLELVYSQWFN